MSLKTRLQVSIVSLVVTIVVALSVLNIHGMLQTRFQDSLELARFQAGQVYGFLLRLLTERTALRDPPPRDLEETKKFWTEIIEQDTGLASLLEKLAGNSRYIVEVVVTGEDDRILAASLPSRQGQKLPPLPRFEDFERKSLWVRMNELLAQNQDYEVIELLGLPEQLEPVFTVRVILSTVFLRAELMPQIQDLAIVSAVSVLLSMLLAVLASNLAFRPLARIGEIIDRITKGEATVDAASEAESKELAVVESKLSLLGEQFRGAQADASELRTNINQLLDRMEEAVLFFGRDDRLVMAGSGAERLLGWGRWEAMGKSLAEIFPASTDLGAIVQGAVHLRREVKDHPALVERDDAPPVRLLVSVETVEDFPGRQRMGTLVTLRDATPRRQIESQLDIATRLAAISRLTSGAAHEIKNPLNSIALHLEVLKSKLDSSAPGTQSEIEVITREITRLDRVVKSFLDFTRPVDLAMKELDFAKIVSEVASLVRPDADSQGVEIAVEDTPEEALVQGDRDLLMQAILNVVVNGVESMKQGGGRLRIRLQEDSGEWLLTVRDQGSGIAPEMQDKIYNLYFTTKGKGSGIGLAVTFRVVQLHGGTIDFNSEPGTGTEFHIRLPAAKEDRRQPPQTVSAAPVPKESAGPERT